MAGSGEEYTTGGPLTVTVSSVLFQTDDPHSIETFPMLVPVRTVTLTMTTRTEAGTVVTWADSSQMVRPVICLGTPSVS